LFFYYRHDAGVLKDLRLAPVSIEQAIEQGYLPAYDLNKAIRSGVGQLEP